MALHVLRSALCRSTRRSSSVLLTKRASVHTLSKIGKREVVGYGFNGTAAYMDRPIFAMPAVRFKEPTPEYECLNAKQQLPWNRLSIQEKKALYRYSFCQTFAEMNAGPAPGEWKMHIGICLMLTALGIWISLWQYAVMYDDFPDTYSEERQKAQLARILALEVNPINGLSSKWDYENKKWK